MASTPRIDELRKKFEENPRRYFAPLANEYRKAGEIEQAISICREYLPQQPGHMSGHIVYGQALYEARQFEEAKTVFETALSLDPENLIALRHLGDIALIVGDSEAARMWYRRVLEADPRNEEIQAQLATLDKAATEGAPGETTPVSGTAAASVTPVVGTPAAPAPAASARKPTPSSAPTVVISAVQRPEAAAEPPAAPPAKVTADSLTAEIHLDEIPAPAAAEIPTPIEPTLEVPAATPPVEMALGFEPTSVGPSEPPLPTAALELDTPISASQTAPPLDSFSLEGLETTSLAAPPSPPPAPAEASALPDLDLSIPAAPSAAPAPPAEPLPDLDLGSISAAPAATPEPAPVAAIPELEFAAPEPSAPPPAAAPEAELPLLDLGELPAAAPAPLVSAAAPEPVAAEAPVLEDWAPPPVAPTEAPAPEPIELMETPAPAPDSGPFVTETMAELYLQQGHPEEALRVYRALLEQRPDDRSLPAKIAAVEAALRPPAPAVAPAAAAPAPPPPPRPRVPPPPPPGLRAGPTIREVLNVIALRRPGFRPEPPRQNGGTPTAPPSAPSAPALRAAPTPSRSSALASDGLAVVFGNVRIGDADEGAALALAHAFAGMNGAHEEAGGAGEQPAEIVGAPAHRAANDLSLDSVFGGAVQPAAAPSSFSFDQFFSQRATSEQAADASADTAAAEPRDDVAQFTQWLEGLKQK